MAAFALITALAAVITLSQMFPLQLRGINGRKPAGSDRQIYRSTYIENYRAQTTSD